MASCVAVFFTRALQALEAIKLLVGHTHDKLLVERFLIFDGDEVTFRTVKLRSRDLNCPVCSENPTMTKLIDYEVFCKAQAKEKVQTLSTNDVLGRSQVVGFPCIAGCRFEVASKVAQTELTRSPPCGYLYRPSRVRDHYRKFLSGTFPKGANVIDRFGRFRKDDSVLTLARRAKNPSFLPFS
ncbi:Adenylyltransferase and sulfurtransferase MOCS3 [Papilio machaon]|uniref:Adenylyltransferase and sulfurtransferase MOCS3 n=1 Tax=Papilio machaon TaxID=76193 RepID=A0A0N1PG88_PAPMA|nr:Adenylyltransferase and sulfurtransferase MOCS3 [Papilio machaon]